MSVSFGCFIFCFLLYIRHKKRRNTTNSTTVLNRTSPIKRNHCSFSFSEILTSACHFRYTLNFYAVFLLNFCCFSWKRIYHNNQSSKFFAPLKKYFWVFHKRLSYSQGQFFWKRNHFHYGLSEFFCILQPFRRNFYKSPSLYGYFKG